MFWEKHTNTKHKTEKQQRLCVSLFHLHLGQISEALLFFSFLFLFQSLSHTHTHTNKPRKTKKKKKKKKKKKQKKEEKKQDERDNKHTYWSGWDSGGKFLLGTLLPWAWHSPWWYNAQVFLFLFLFLFVYVCGLESEAIYQWLILTILFVCHFHFLLFVFQCVL